MTATMPRHSPLSGYEATTPAVFRTIFAFSSEPGSDRALVPVTAAFARLAGARLVTAGPPLDVIPQVGRRERADAVAISTGSADAVQIARRLLDAGTTVLAVPPWQSRHPRLAHIGIAYDGGSPAQAAFPIARDLADGGRGERCPQPWAMHLTSDAGDRQIWRSVER